MVSPTKAWTNLRQAMIDDTPSCSGDDRFVAEDSDLSDLAPICRQCPLFVPCSDLANVSSPIPVWGVLGGRMRRSDRPTGLMNAKAMGRLVGG